MAPDFDAPLGKGSGLAYRKRVRPCLLTYDEFLAELLPCRENHEWNMLGLFIM